MATHDVKPYGDGVCHRYTLTTGETATLITPDITKGSVGVFPTTPGTGTVSTTISHPDFIAASTAEWSEWPFEVVSTNTPAHIFESRITAIKMTAAGGGGSVVFEILLEKDM